MSDQCESIRIGVRLRPLVPCEAGQSQCLRVRRGARQVFTAWKPRRFFQLLKGLNGKPERTCLDAKFKNANIDEMTTDYMSWFLMVFWRSEPSLFGKW